MHWFSRSPGKQPVGLGRAWGQPVQGQGEGLLLHQPLRPLPGGLPQRVVLGHHVEIRPQGAAPSFWPTTLAQPASTGGQARAAVCPPSFFSVIEHHLAQALRD